MFTTLFVQPIYNLFVFLIGIMPGGDAGLAIIVLTLLMRIVLYPVFSASIRSQMNMQAMQAELEETKHRFKEKSPEFAKHQLELARKYKVNPLSLIGSLVIQFGLIIALYVAMFREGFPDISQNLLYSFVHAPAVVSTNLFGILDLLTPHHLVVAALVGITQYFAIRLTLARTSATQNNLSPEKAATQRMQSTMMLYVMPALLTVFGYFFPAAVALYFIASNVISLGQEWLIRRQLSARA